LRLIPMTDYVYSMFEELRQGSAFSQTQKGQSRASINWPDDSNPEAVVIPLIDIKKSLAVAADKVGLPKLTRHMMRHTFATFFDSKGATDMDLMDLGGWKSVAMVRRYRKIVDERLDDVMHAFNENGEEQISERQPRPSKANRPPPFPTAADSTDRHCRTTADAPLTDVYRQPLVNMSSTTAPG
jgi:hypothetical protein